MTNINIINLAVLLVSMEQNVFFLRFDFTVS